MTLENLRKQIDEIDSDLLSLLDKRLQIAKAVGELKKEKGIPILDEKREQELLEKLQEKAKEKGIDESFILELYKLILSQSKKEQQ